MDAGRQSHSRHTFARFVHLPMRHPGAKRAVGRVPRRGAGRDHRRHPGIRRRCECPDRRQDHPASRGPRTVRLGEPAARQNRFVRRHVPREHSRCLFHLATPGLLGREPEVRARLRPHGHHGESRRGLHGIVRITHDRGGRLQVGARLRLLHRRLDGRARRDDGLRDHRCARKHQRTGLPGLPDRRQRRRAVPFDRQRLDRRGQRYAGVRGLTRCGQRQRDHGAVHDCRRYGYVRRRLRLGVRHAHLRSGRHGGDDHGQRRGRRRPRTRRAHDCHPVERRQRDDRHRDGDRHDP